MAIEQFADEAYLDDIAGNGGGQGDGGTGESGDGLATGADRKSDAAIDAILATYGDVRVVRALGRFRGSEKALRGLGTIARRGDEVGGLAVEYPCRAASIPTASTVC